MYILLTNLSWRIYPNLNFDICLRPFFTFYFFLLEKDVDIFRSLPLCFWKYLHTIFIYRNIFRISFIILFITRIVFIKTFFFSIFFIRMRIRKNVYILNNIFRNVFFFYNIFKLLKVMFLSVLKMESIKITDKQINWDFLLVFQNHTKLCWLFPL